MIARFGFLQAKKGVWEVVKISTGPWVQYADYEQALAEKEHELQQIREHEFQRGYREGEAAMMAQAVRFAECLADKCRCPGMNENPTCAFNEAIAFLKEHP